MKPGLDWTERRAAFLAGGFEVSQVANPIPTAGSVEMVGFRPQNFGADKRCRGGQQEQDQEILGVHSQEAAAITPAQPSLVMFVSNGKCYRKKAEFIVQRFGRRIPRRPSPVQGRAIGFATR